MNVVVNGLEFHVVVEGPTNGVPVVFLHGLAASASVWDGQAERLSDRFRVVRYDLRSHGSSQASSRECTRSELAGELIGVLDALVIERAFVVGHSAGGVIAMHAGIEHRERVLGLVLVGTASECNDKTAAWYRSTAELAREKGGAEAVKAMGMRAREGRIPDGEGFASMAMAMRTLNQDPLTERLRALDVPALIIVGEKDFLGVGGSVILNRALGGSELEIVAGRGHGIYIEDPDWFAARIARFFDRVVASDT